MASRSRGNRAQNRSSTTRTRRLRTVRSPARRLGCALALFLVRLLREGQVARTLLGDREDQVVGSDRFGAYNVSARSSQRKRPSYIAYWIKDWENKKGTWHPIG